jgi:hypothetical protein
MNLTAPFSTPTFIRTAAAAGALVLLAALSGCATADTGAGTEPSASAAATAEPDASGDCAGITVVVDFGPLDAQTVSHCFDATEALIASEAVTTAGFTLEGTAEWGDAIACRVDGRPAADETVVVEGQESFTETCATMPSASAYWALWSKTAADADWTYVVDEGIGTLEVEPGQSVGLVYSTGTETPTPGS